MTLGSPNKRRLACGRTAYTWRVRSTTATEAATRGAAVDLVFSQDFDRKVTRYGPPSRRVCNAPGLPRRGGRPAPRGATAGHGGGPEARHGGRGRPTERGARQGVLLPGVVRRAGAQEPA